ncbi:hypothetical protein V8E51_011725 [Hyaloscypha variabilis]
MAARFNENPKFCWKGPEFKYPVELVTFIVSKDGVEETFPVHKEHACYYSPVLKAAFNSDFIEGQTQTYRLEDTNPKIFSLLIQWFYTQNFKHRPLDGENRIVVRNRSIWDATGDTPPSDEINSMYLNMVGLYILAECLIIPRLQNHIMRSLLEMAEREAWSTVWMETTYEGTSAESPLRCFAVDMLLYEVPSSWIKKHEKHFPRELLIDYAVRETLRGGANGVDYSHTRVILSYMVHETPYPNNVS